VFPIKGADSTFRPFLTRIIPIKDHEGKVIRWLGTNTDIARQKELEQMKDDFLSITSHELKTPVTTIKAYGQIAEGLLAKKGDLETLGMIQKMGTQVKKLTTLIEELLDITKIQKGRLVYKEEFFDFNQLVNEVVEDMQKTSSTHQIYLHFESSAEVFGDRDKISQVINNLISNAIKYSPGAERIIIRSENKADGMQLSVQDFGIGIGSAEKTKVFEQFYRVGGESQTTFPGMGIGLFISSEIVRRHGGKIWVESMVKQGSTFFVWLPFDHRTAQ
jgi:signal transduction histidine kinase